MNTSFFLVNDRYEVSEKNSNQDNFRLSAIAEVVVVRALTLTKLKEREGPLLSFFCFMIKLKE